MNGLPSPLAASPEGPLAQREQPGIISNGVKTLSVIPQSLFELATI